MGGKQISYQLPMTLVWILVCGGFLGAGEYTLSFEQRGRFEQGLPGARRAGMTIQVWADGKLAREISLPTHGPQWNVQSHFTAADPRHVQLGLRLTMESWVSADPEIGIGNLRVKDARGGDAALVGKWTPERTDPSVLLSSCSFEPLPAFRNGFSLHHAYGMWLKGDNQYGQWRFEGAIVPSVHLQLRRLFEYAGCYGELNFFDDWKNVTFSPAKPAAGAAVTVTAKVRNAGSLDARGAKVSLLVDGKLAEGKTVDIPAVSAVLVPFRWTATEGFHCFVVRAEAGEDQPRLSYDDNWLLRVLVVGDVCKAHPYLLFRAPEVAKLKARLVDPPAWYAGYYEAAKRQAGWIQPENRSGGLDSMEEPRSMVAAANAFLALVAGDFRPLDERRRPVKQTSHGRAVAFLQGVWGFSRGWFSDAPCSIVHYAQAYDWTAATLSPEEDREIRNRLAKAVEELVVKLAAGTDPRFEKPQAGKTSYPARKRSYSQGSYIDACGIVVGALALAGDERADAWLHFGINAIYEEILNSMTTPDGYYREGQGYTEMAESRSGAACWLSLANVGANPHQLYPLVGKIHDLYIRDRMPNGWNPPINDNRIDSLPQALFAPLYTDAATRAAARWDWKNQDHTPRGESPDAHYGVLFLLADTPEADREPAAPPPWTPTQFLGDFLVFRSDWSPGAAYLCLNSKHFPTVSASHDQNDKNSFLMYAKKAFLAIDPGYGNTAGELAALVSSWCRGDSPYNHNMVLVDGQRPSPSAATTPYTYPNSPLPENAFTTAFFDFGEAAAKEWSFIEAKTNKLCVVNDRRSVLFPHLSGLSAEHYFIVVDALDGLTEGTHTFDFVLNGNCRHPYLDRAHPGDFISNARRPEDVPLADNLTIQRQGGGVEARWLVGNADGKDVLLRAFLAAPAPDHIQAGAGNGWLGYARPFARNRYLDVKVEGARNVRFLTLLYPALVGDAKDDVQMERLGEGATLTFPDGRIHLVTIKGEDPKAAAGPVSESSDADITWRESTAAGKLNACFLVRGSMLEHRDTPVKASARVDTLALDFRGADEVRGYLSAAEEVTLRLGLRRPCRKATFNGKPLAVTYDAGTVVVRGLRGAGELRLTIANKR
jgi:hypothetical protein